MVGAAASRDAIRAEVAELLGISAEIGRFSFNYSYQPRRLGAIIGA